MPPYIFDANRASLRGLTPKEQEVLRLLSEGLSISEIAAQLGISTASTVRDHISHLRRKLSASRGQLLLRASEEGILVRAEG
jgi:DNA-binding NarL/FixJ family response regulator